MPLFAPRSRGSAPRTVTVYAGDTLWSLAFAYGCTVDELVRANGGVSARSVRPGMKLRLPGGAADAGPWTRFDDGHERRAYRDDSTQQRGGVPVTRLVVALAAGVAVGALRFAPGPVGDGTRAALDSAAAAADSAAKAVVPAAGAAVRRALPFWHAAVSKLGACLQALGRVTSHAIIEALGGTTGREAGSSAGADAATAGLSESSRARVELAQAQALSAAAEAARASLERELAAALAAVEALTQTENAQRALAESQAARSRELELRLDAVRLAAAQGADADARAAA